MDIFLLILLVLLGLAAFALWIVVLVRAFKAGATVWGVLGIFFSILIFIWGWMNAKKENLTTIMLIWTVVIVLELILYIIFMAVAAASYAALPFLPVA